MTQEILIKPDIVAIIGEEGIILKRRGRNLWALCPFHQEKTPSFRVSPDKQVFNCFGCGLRGDVITFVMLYRDLSFKEALSHLHLDAGAGYPKQIDSVKIQKRRLVEAFRKWEKSYYRALCRKRLLLIDMTRELATMREVDGCASLLHALPLVEYRLDILWHGSDEDKFSLWKEVKNGF